MKKFKKKTPVTPPLVLPPNPIFMVSSYSGPISPADGFAPSEEDALKVVRSSAYWISGNYIVDDIWAIPLNKIIEEKSAVKVYGKRYSPKQKEALWVRLDQEITPEVSEAYRLQALFEGSSHLKRVALPNPKKFYLATGSIPGKHFWNSSSKAIGVFASEEAAIRLSPAGFCLEEMIADGITTYNRTMIRGTFNGGFGYASGHGKSDPAYAAYENAKKTLSR